MDSEYQREQVMKRLTEELEKGMKSAETGGWISLDEAESRLRTELERGLEDPKSYTEDEVYKFFGLN